MNVLVIDAWAPTPDRDAASVRMLGLLDILRQLSTEVTFAPEEYAVHRASLAQLWLPDKISRQMEAFRRDPALDIAFAHAEQFHSAAGGTSPAPASLPPSEVMPGYIPSAMVVKRESFFRVGLFETHWVQGEFASWYCRASELGLSRTMLPDLLVRRRRHSENNGVVNRQAITDFARILKASLDRRRAAARNRGEV